jgi:hypothetical protein
VAPFLFLRRFSIQSGHNRGARTSCAAQEEATMAKSKKGSVKVKDMSAKNNPKGGYLKIKMTDTQITSVKLPTTSESPSSNMKIKVDAALNKIKY